MCIGTTLKKTIIAILFLFVFSLLTTPVASASTSLQQEAQQQNRQNLISDQDEKFYELVSQEVSTTQEGNDTVRTISDYQVDQALKEAYGYTDSQLADMGQQSPNKMLLRKAGSTKIVFHGAKKNGNFDLYLSASMLNKIKKAGIGVGISIIAAVTGAFPGVGVAVSWAIKKTISTMIVNGGSKFKAGRILYSRNFQWAGWRYQ
ncbi:hypothetical protein [Weissella paramesenteroides]|uniref:hypothetical protein n=1 Tax=Weissella paramesenteroides TaxID=1249 RepID=UPI002E7BFC50|nr:hypothetical protein [Weissella paramesenteroides]WPQ67367.1 hypothetical protein QRX23_06185 [Weissella paramesenteroides]